ncbi:MAG: protein-L-isoaspartate(D-aspartate) O-methyltransferase [Planctomycetaceae bacterium]
MSELEEQKRGLLDSLGRRDVTDARVLQALARVPRERFVPPSLHHRAYENIALPIAGGQTISQPLMVALMTQELALAGNELVLEIGTGSGYQTAILAELASEVVTIERIPELAENARTLLAELGYANIDFRIGDGSLGCPDRAPFDAIIVTAGAPDYPAPLYRQLKVGGRLVIPVGDESAQTLQVVTKREQGPEIRDAGGCRFVRLIGDAAWPDE